MTGVQTCALPISTCWADWQGDKVIASDGKDVTQEFELGANNCLKKVNGSKAPLAVLKAKSPSCGAGLIYDGTYTAKLIKGDGVFTSKLREEEICVVTEEMERSGHINLLLGNSSSWTW